MYLAFRCAEKPDDPTMYLPPRFPGPNQLTRILCFPIQIKSKWYPLLLILLFNLIFYIKIDFLFAAIIGLLDFKLLRKYELVSRERFIALENSEYLEVLKLSSGKKEPRNAV